ncbi:hypothetical protein PVAP13_9NG236300 [Panicum virgatum]|uniref:Uncharacterized protein n=1 Tax=Panicum virgatum TaxID=38727 RepID=A0A8T0MLF5_PANVG|nr:hypothetical protein PVAP13_9NG236300 [Panicum virgatum]
MRCRWENRSGISPNRGSGWCRWPQQPPSTSSYACRESSAVVAVPLPPPHLCRTGDSDRGGRGGPKCQLGWGDAQGVGGGRIRRRASHRCHGRARDEGGGRGGGPAPPPWEGAGGGRGMGRRAAPRGREGCGRTPGDTGEREGEGRIKKNRLENTSPPGHITTRR